LTGRLITDHSTPEEVVGGANAPEPASELEVPHSQRPAQHARASSVSALGAFAGLGAAVLCLAFSPKVSSQTFTPKFAVVLLFAAVGIVPLARLVQTRSPLRWPARAAVAFLVVALVSALLSPSPNIGIFGLYLWGTGWLLWLAVAGAFAIGASLGPNDRQWLFGGLLVGALANALVAVIQIVWQPQNAALALYDGSQADGLLGNPIHLEALLLGALALILRRTCQAPRRWGAAVLLLAVGIEFTFERFALLILLILILYALYAYGMRRGGVFGLLVAVGYAAAYASRGSGLGSRVVAGTDETTFGTRIRIWWEGAHYMLHHPLLGAGPGQLRTAMDSIATLSFFQHVLAGKILTDGHDIFVEVGVTTGVLGLACFLLWLLGATRVARPGAFLGFAASLLGVELVEPLNVAILPLVFLGLGAATAVRLRPVESAGAVGYQSTVEPPVEASPVQRRAANPYGAVITALAVVMALFLGVTMVLGDAKLFSGTSAGLGQPYNLADAHDANRLLPYWPDSALEVAQIEAFDSSTAVRGSRAILEDSRHWTVVAVGRDPRNPHLWTLLGGADIGLKAYGLARVDFHRALSCDRWYTQALDGLGQVAGVQGDWTEAVHWYALALTTVVRLPEAAYSIRGLLKGAELHTSARK
jgi:O-antigen ligase